MSSKRKGRNLTSKKTKMPRSDEEPVRKNGEIKKISPTKLRELELVLGQDVCNLHELRLIQEILKTTVLEQSLSVRILRFAITVQNSSIVQQLLCHQTIHLNNQEGGELLWKAVAAGDATIATLLVQSNASLSVRNPDNNSTILHGVVGCWEIKDVAQREMLTRLMLKHGANVNAVDAKGRSVLYEVLHWKDCSSELVEELLNRGADVKVDKKTDSNDLFWASAYKPQLLSRLVEHQVPNKEARNLRGVIAIAYLIQQKHPDSLQIIKQILDQGVPVNTVNPYAEGFKRNRPCSLLGLALWAKKTDVIKLLVEYGADVHCKDKFGHTPLYQATWFKGYTIVTRLLLEAGATIDEQNDNDRYPIHGACETESLRNIHLLLGLGADINVTDNEGYTPFDSMDKTKLSDAGCLVVRQFAIIIAKGGTIGARDRKRLDTYIHAELYQDCIAELEKMKVTNLCNGVSYFSLLSDDVGNMMQIMKNSELTRNFKKNAENIAIWFPIYCYVLVHSLTIAKIQYKKFLSNMNALYKGAEGVLPDLVIEKIAYYFKLNLYAELKRCQYDYYMSLHSTLKNNKADKAKIL